MATLQEYLGEQKNITKKYVVFQFDKYYPGGVLDDITGNFDSLDEVREFIFKDKFKYDYYVIVDKDTWNILYSTY